MTETDSVSFLNGSCLTRVLLVLVLLNFLASGLISSHYWIERFLPFLSDFYCFFFVSPGNSATPAT